MTEFDHFPPETLSFLAGLKANNTRDWFAANRAVYEAAVKEPATAFCAAMGAALAAMTGEAQVAKVYRIHRDVRFSKDKTPYNAHLHISFAPEAAKGTPPMWFFGLSPERLSLGCGVFQYEKAGLDAFREAMAGQAGRDLTALAGTLRGKGLRMSEPELKRVPAGFEKDHPNAEALRRKGFSAWTDLEDPSIATRPGLVARTIAELKPLLPVYRLMSAIG